MCYYVYIITNKRYGTLYTGMTNDLLRRINEHHEGLVPGFSSKYGLKTLVYYETHDDVTQAQKREFNIKDWKRQWKIEMIEQSNPNWYHLYPDVLRKIN